jgi:hypothetical protein
MPITLNKSRPADAYIVCAMGEFTQPTPRLMAQGFDAKQSRVETHIPNLSVAVAPVNNTADNPASTHPYVQFADFFLPSVPKTARL